MSGVEVAGLVLGTIPLLLASLQHYERVVGTVTIFFHFRNEISSAIRELEREHVLFEQAIHLLLAPITMDEELREMMADTNSPLWQDLDICEDMRRNLGRAYPSYLRTVQDIQNIMIDIATKLEDVHGVRTIQQHGLKALIAQVRMDALLDFDNSTTQFGISRRLKYAMGRNRMKKLLKELREHIQSLDRIQDKAVKIAVATESFKATRRSSTRLLAPHVRKNANRLHEALSQAFCSNHTSHSTALLLESRIAKTPWTGENNKNRLQSPIVNNRTDRFQLSVLHSPLLLPSKWLDFQVRVLESPVQGGQTSAHSNSPVTGSSADASIGIFSRLHKVTDMCTTLKSFSDSCPGFYVERNGNLVGTYHVQQDIVHADELTCLDDILRKKPGSINPQDGYSLAIILTASLLHLSHTPWLLSTLDKTDIAFLRLKGCTSSRLIDIKQPYLVREIFKNHSQNAHGGIQPKDAFTMAALGIVLLEIYYRLPVESMEGLGSSGVPLDHVDSIQRWVEDRENRGELTFAFAKSVKYCLQCTKEPDKKLLEPTFLADIELNVLKPLEEELHMLVHGPWGI